MNILEFRKEHPEYNSKTDEELSKALHAKYYSDKPYEEFKAAFIPENDAVQQQKKPHNLDFFSQGAADTFNKFIGGDISALSPLQTLTGMSGIDILRNISKEAATSQKLPEEFISQEIQKYPEQEAAIRAVGSMEFPTGRFMNALSPLRSTLPARSAGATVAVLSPSMIGEGSAIQRRDAAERAVDYLVNEYRKSSPTESSLESLPLDVMLGSNLLKGVEGGISELPFFEKFLGAAPEAATWLGRQGQRLGQGMFGGGFFGGLGAAGQGESIPKGVAFGMALGGPFSVTGGLLSDTIFALRNKISRLTPAMKRLAEIASKSGQTQEEMLANLQKARTVSGENAVLADTYPIYQSHLGESLAVSPLPKANEAIVSGLKQRAEETSKNVLKAMDRITGTSADKSAALAANMDALRAEAKPIFDKFGRQPVVLDQEGVRLISKLNQKGYAALKESLVNKNIIDKGYLPDKLSDFARYKQPVPFAFLDEARQMANSIYNEAFRAGGSGKGFNIVSKEIQNYAKKVGDRFGKDLTGVTYSDFLKRYGTESSNQEALELGQKIFSLPPREVNKFIASHSTLDRDYLRQGVRDAIESKMSGVATGTESEIKSIMSRQKTRDLFSFIADSPGQSRALADLFHEGTKSLVTSAKAIVGHEAGLTAEAARSFAGKGTGPITEVVKHNYLNAFRQAVADISKFGHNERTVQMADEMAKFLSSSGKEAQSNIDKLFKTASTLKGREKVGAYKYLQVLSGKLANQAQQTAFPENNNGK